MTAEHTPKKVKVLTRLKITEVSAVDRGAGERCRIVLSKRDNDDSRLNLTDIFKGKITAAQALGIRVNKSFAATARGDEADLQDEQTSADELVGGAEHHASRVANLLVESGSHNSREDALAYLLHHPRGAAMLRRLSKHHEDSPMPLDPSAIIKNYGVVALCKYMIESSSSFGIDEHQLVALATEDAQRRYPSDTSAGAFAKLFMESSELREAVEIAKSAALQDAVTAEVERDSRAACAELAAIGKQRWPSLSSAQRFARAAETNPAILARAHRRPGPSVSFPHPVVKEKQPMVASLEPRVSDETNVDDPARALEQLKQIARERWPNESEAQAFINVMSNAEYGELINRALARPTESSPPRQ
jgi:hypothetical protein